MAKVINSIIVALNNSLKYFKDIKLVTENKISDFKLPTVD